MLFFVWYCSRCGDWLWGACLKGQGLSLGKGKIFYALLIIETSFRAHLDSCSVGTMSSFPAGKVAGVWSWLPDTSSWSSAIL
jgi:hypothetical protein